jgi:short-subunit dehydrogenase
VPHARQGFYTASKHAVLGLSDVLRAELPPHIHVSVLCPGLVKSNLWDAERNRPSELGAGAGSDERKTAAKAILERGMDPIEFARRALAGVERDDFLVVTHPHARGIAERRWREIAAAFDRQAPYQPGCDKYDVNAIVQELMK